MPDRDKLLALIREHGLDALPVTRKDAIDVQAAHFAAAIRGYAASCAENLGGSDLAWDRFRLATTLYGPGLVEALSSALLETADG